MINKGNHQEGTAFRISEWKHGAVFIDVMDDILGLDIQSLAIDRTRCNEEKTNTRMNERSTNNGIVCSIRKEL